jgi:hypothetical protein
LVAPHTSIFELRDERLVLDGLYHWAVATAKARSKA